MSRNHHSSSHKRSPKGVGFYIALAVCLAAIGASVWSTADSIHQLRSPVLTGSGDSSPAEQVGNPVSGVPYDSSQPMMPEESSSSAAEAPSSSVDPPSGLSQTAETLRPIRPVTSTPSKEEAPPSSRAPVTETTFIMPVSGRVLKPFSESAYSMTFGDWRAHHGVDLAAAKGANVVAVGDGTVKEIRTDDLLGTVAVVEHNGLEIWYCGLGSNPSVKAGEKVMCGQVLGVLREVPGESVEESHLHLQVKQDGQWVEPLAALGKETPSPSEPA